MPVRRRLSGDGVPPGRAVAALRSRAAPVVKRISSVSGGSITAGVLGLNWAQAQLRSGAAAARISCRRWSTPIRSLAGETIDAESIILGIALPGPGQRPRRRGLRRASVRRCDPAGPARRAALRDQRDQRPVRRALALHEAVHARLPRRRGATSRQSACRARWPRPRPFRRCCRRWSCGSIRRVHAEFRRRTCSARRSRPT